MRFFFSLVIMAIFLVVLIGGTIYMARRLHVAFPQVSYKTLLWTLSAILLLVFVAMLSLSTTANFAGQILFCLASLLVGYLLYFLLSLLVVDLVNLVVAFSPRLNGIMSLSLAGLVVIYGIWHASVPLVKEVEIPLRGLAKEVRAVQLTDVHLGHFRGQRHVRRMVDKVQELNPEVIFHTGDLFDARSRLQQEVLNPLTEITVPHYFVEGNHDNYVGAAEVFALARNAGLIVLENEVASFGELQIVGLKHMLADKESFDMHAPEEGKTVKEVLAEMEIDAEKPTIMLHHSPDGVAYAQEKKIDLLLAGHTHGGQVFPLTLAAKFLFGYNRGIYAYQDLAIYVSDGVGTMFAPMRVGTHSEITLLRLVPADR
jgi:predicted MPP superfamily phosphohydrolase